MHSVACCLSLLTAIYPVIVLGPGVSPRSASSPRRHTTPILLDTSSTHPSSQRGSVDTTRPTCRPALTRTTGMPEHSSSLSRSSTLLSRGGLTDRRRVSTKPLTHQKGDTFEVEFFCRGHYLQRATDMVAVSGVGTTFVSLVGLVIWIVFLSPTSVNATALTYKIDANERGCFYAWVDKVGEKIAFYFAVAASCFLLICRFKQVARLILITRSRIPIRKSFWTGQKKDREISSLQHSNRENTLFVSPTT
jgi:hypothetical protein